MVPTRAPGSCGICQATRPVGFISAGQHFKMGSCFGPPSDPFSYFGTRWAWRPLSQTLSPFFVIEVPHLKVYFPLLYVLRFDQRSFPFPLSLPERLSAARCGPEAQDSSFLTIRRQLPVSLSARFGSLSFIRRTVPGQLPPGRTIHTNLEDPCRFSYEIPARKSILQSFFFPPQNSVAPCYPLFFLPL